ncbi:DUF485 domain-containing protein [Streptomyces sp. NPDC049915]|uniref:DUF485 domain-containing protein n=1 Tax=Streptomyces sp. NPDC049915 TaxID=3155510 RepID=UPI003445543B
MTYADENQYPPPGPPGWPPPRGQAPSYGAGAPGHDRFGQATWGAPYAYQAEHHADLAALRSAYRRLRRVSTLTALGSFVMYVVLACCAPGLMGSRIAGELSLGMALGVLQLFAAFAAVFWYGRSARRSVDPQARAVRERAAAAGRNAGAAR